MQELLDHLLSKKLKSATALVLQSPDGKQLISNNLEENTDIYKKVAYQLIAEQKKLICYGSLCHRDIDNRYGAAYGIFDHPHWAALVVLWDRFQPDIVQDSDENSRQDENSTQDENSRQDDLKWLKSNWTRIISTFKAADQIFCQELGKREKLTKLVISSATDDMANKITHLFENMLLKRNRKFEADECWATVGIDNFRNKIEQHIRKGEPISLVMPSFPFKSGNTRTKVIGTLPDMAEKLGLERLEEFLRSLRQIYSPGGKLLIFMDGRVYCDLYRIHDSTVNEFSSALRKMVDPKTSDIEWMDLDEIFPNRDYSNDNKRQALLNVFGISLDKVVDRINSDAEFCEVYNGIKKFMREELSFSNQWSERTVRQECGRIAKLMVQRTDAYQSLIRCICPYHIRLSIHPSTSTTKFSVDLVGKTDWGTPWHNCALLQPDQTWALIRRATAEKHGFELRKCDDGMHYFINNSGAVFTEKL